MAGFSMAGRAGAQNIPEPPRPTCVEGCTRGGSSSTESVDERNARWAAIAEARREAKAERDAENAKRKAQKAAQKLKDQQDKQKAQDEARQKAENDRKAAEAEQQRQLNTQREREAEAERQRQLAIEAQRLQAAFDTIKPDAVGALKGVEGDPAGASRADDGLNLKGVDGEPGTGSAQPDWMATITDPQVAKIAHHLGSIVPPLPIPKEEVALNWKKVYLNDDRLMNTADWVVAAWETTGVLGAPIKIPCKALLIAGKSFIAQEDSAYLYLVKKDQDYNAALAYLKNPAQAQTFAHLLDDVRQHRELPANADPAMVKAVRAITDPKLGNTATVVWDS
ncbi:MAG TPA: hypothetical protein VKF63_08745, partial [Terracidiphilus sp.]|nr:hypothetical protein [Terracidiphilus sp.]